MGVIEDAEARIRETRNKWNGPSNMAYWEAYLDGARAEKAEIEARFYGSQLPVEVGAQVYKIRVRHIYATTERAQAGHYAKTDPFYNRYLVWTVAAAKATKSDAAFWGRTVFASREDAEKKLYDTGAWRVEEEEALKGENE